MVVWGTASSCKTSKLKAAPWLWTLYACSKLVMISYWIICNVKFNCKSLNFLNVWHLELMPYTFPDWQIHFDNSKWVGGSWFLPVALVFLLPVEAIDFHSSTDPCCSPLLQAIWLQFKASKIEKSLFQRACTAHCATGIFNITKAQQDEHCSSSKPGQIKCYHIKYLNLCSNLT